MKVKLVLFFFRFFKNKGSRVEGRIVLWFCGRLFVYINFVVFSNRVENIKNVWEEVWREEKRRNEGRRGEGNEWMGVGKR